jgi:hypothetical protein
VSFTQVAVLILAAVVVLAFATAASATLLWVLGVVAGVLVLIDSPLLRR